PAPRAAGRPAAPPPPPRPAPGGRHGGGPPARGGRPRPGPHVVVHCAAAVGDPLPGSPAEAAMHAVNVDGTSRLLQAAAGRPVVWVSSASVYEPGTGRSRLNLEPPVAGALKPYGPPKGPGVGVARAARGGGRPPPGGAPPGGPAGGGGAGPGAG
ncbi:NAD-dependent epimerase/dehydratase family protein, partial [Streptomyces fradiae]|uniref:NAD-dependent epimerase/dehydratase family protein n=1 Tax=Streptomyces fradiae TaxID=1906 RepID=UPI0036C85DAC